MSVLARVRGNADRDGKPSLEFSHDLTPEELYMSQDDLEQLVGDGLAKVTVSSDRATKYMGSGHSVFCAVSLTCNQDRDTIRDAQHLAASVVLDFLPVFDDLAVDTWEALEDD